MTPAEQRAEAHRLLARPSIAAEPEMLRWAVGASLAWSAATIVRSWAGESIGAERWGHAGDGVYLDGGWRRATLRHHHDGPVVAEVSLSGAARLVVRHRLPAALVAEAKASARRYAQGRGGADCEAAAAAIWEHVRPVATSVQLDLFALAGGGRA